jgi:Protein of unknown function (DUF2490)
MGISFQSKSQNTFVQEWQAWFRYYNQAQLNNKLILHTELDERRRLDPWSQAQFFTHVHLHYRVNSWLDVAAGMNYNLTTLTTTNLVVEEWRPWQEVSLFKDLGKDVLFQFRYRLDERFIHRNDKQVLLDGYIFNWRHRFRIQFSRPIAQFNNNRTLTLKFSDEVMLNSGDVLRVFDQNRIFAALEMKLNNHWSIESGYLNLIQQATDDVFSERHVIRTTLYHHIGFK